MKNWCIIVIVYFVVMALMYDGSEKLVNYLHGICANIWCVAWVIIKHIDKNKESKP